MSPEPTVKEMLVKSATQMFDVAQEAYDAERYEAAAWYLIQSTKLLQMIFKLSERKDTESYGVCTL